MVTHRQMFGSQFDITVRHNPVWMRPYRPYSEGIPMSEHGEYIADLEAEIRALRYELKCALSARGGAAAVPLELLPEKKETK